MRIHRSWHLVRPSPTTLTRILHEATLSLFALPNMVRGLWGARRAFIVSPALSFAFAASLAARLMRVPITLVVKDIQPEAAVELGMMRSRLMISVSAWMARVIYGLAAEIHTLGDGMRRRIACHTAEASKIRVVPDTVDPDELAPPPFAENAFRDRFVPHGTFAVLHTGNMGKKQDLDLLLRAADRMREDTAVHFYVFGDGAMKDEFLRKRGQMGLRNVSHHPLQERPLLRHMLSGADVVLVSQLPEVVDIVVPSKLLTAMAAGGMIVAACAEASETARLIEESGGGILVPASDDEALAGAIRRVRTDEVNVDAHRCRARKFAVQTFGREAVYGPLALELGAAPALEPSDEAVTAV
jgi:colanic acid biosynthesis glycosyl transferase WcaI